MYVYIFISNIPESTVVTPQLSAELDKTCCGLRLSEITTLKFHMYISFKPCG